MNYTEFITRGGQVQFITHSSPQWDYESGAREALQGGCRWIQLRMKEASPTDILPIARRLANLCHEAHATFILDDHVELVKPSGADGVHLGQHDMPVDEARRLLGAQAIIGGTANTLEQIREHARRGADYVGCGPFRYTTTKANLSPLLGLEGYMQLMQSLQQENLMLPIVAIGGIERSDIPNLLKTGVNGIALSGSVLRAEQPAEEMQRIVDIVNRTDR